MEWTWMVNKNRLEISVGCKVGVRSVVDLRLSEYLLTIVIYMFNVVIMCHYDMS